MPRAKATFDVAGGELFATVACEPPCDGVYTLRLWEKGQNAVVKTCDGNFINAADDRYGLKLPNDVHDGRLLQAQVTVAVPSGAPPATISLRVEQDGAVIGRQAATAVPGSDGRLVLLFVELAAR